MVVNIYHAISGGLLAKMGNVNSRDEAVLSYAEQMLDEPFQSVEQFVEKWPMYAAGLIAVVLQ